MHQFILSLQSEFYKSRKTLAFWSALILPVVICGVIATGYFFNSNKMGDLPGEVQWVRYIGSIMGVMGTLLLPIFAVFVGYSVNNIEHRSEMWKSLFSLPLSKWSIYSSKYAFATLLIALCLGLFCGLLLASGTLLGWFRPQLNFGDFNATTLVFALHVKLFLSVMGILSVQFLLSLIWADFLKPMGVGFVGTILGIISANTGWEHAYFMPYAHPLLSIMGTRTKEKISEVIIMSNETYVSLGVALMTFVLGYFIVSKRSVR